MRFYVRLLIAIIGLAVIGAVFFFNKSYVVEAAVKDGQKYGDWSASCKKEDKKNHNCILTQQINAPASNENKQEVIAIYQIGYFDSKLKMSQLLPTNVSIKPGTAIITDKQLLAHANYSVCTQVGCNAIVEISEAEINKILNSQEIVLGFINADGKQVGLPFSSNGLREGLKAIKGK